MDFLDRMTRVVDYLESHLDDEIDYARVARLAYCNAYQFGRVFAYVVGVPLSEYVRRRRLTLAALDLQAGRARVTDVALRYGYASPDAFARAFRALYGVPPSEAGVPGVPLRLFPRISFQITIKGDVGMIYRIEEMGPIQGLGVVHNLGPWQEDTAKGTWQERSGKRWAVWDDFLNHGPNEIIRDQYRLYRAPLWQFSYQSTLPNGDTLLCIGAEAGEAPCPELQAFTVPAHTWAVFPATGTLNQPVHPIGAALTRALTEWLPVSGYEMDGDSSLEVYGPGNTQAKDYVCELWLPVRRC